MKLRFEVNQAEAFRRGVDCPKSIVTVEVTPSEIPEVDRNLIADRMDGIDVRQLTVGVDENTARQTCLRIIAALPTFDCLLEAVREDEQNIQDQLKEKKKKAA